MKIRLLSPMLSFLNSLRNLLSCEINFNTDFRKPSLLYINTSPVKAKPNNHIQITQ